MLPLLLFLAAEIGATGGAGVTGGEDIGRSFTPAGGVSARWRPLRADYLYADRHFLTGSYVFEERKGRTRAFFQAGAGLMAEKADSSLAVTLGLGVSIDVGASMSIRPELRSYFFVGPGLTLLPTVTISRRF